MSRKQLLVASLLAMGTASANAENPYVEVGYAAVSGEAAGLSIDWGAIRANIGTHLTDNVAVEFMATTELSDANVGTGQVSLDHSWGFFLKPKAKVNDTLEIYGNLGYVNTEVTVTGPGGWVNVRDNSISYGAGLVFNVNQSTAVSLDVTRLYDQDDVTLDSVSLNARFAF